MTEIQHPRRRVPRLVLPVLLVLALGGTSAVLLVFTDSVVSQATRRPQPPTGAAKAGRATARVEGRERAVSLGKSPPKLQRARKQSEQVPSAWNSYREQRSKGGHPDIPGMFAAERRDIAWAPEMEAKLKDRFNPSVLERTKMSSLKVEGLECRSSLCELELSFDNADWDHIRARGDAYNDPASYVGWTTGGYASLLYRPPLVPGDVAVPGSWRVRLREDKRFGVVYILGFSEKEIDPGAYSAWVAQIHARRVPNQTMPELD